MNIDKEKNNIDLEIIGNKKENENDSNNKDLADTNYNSKIVKRGSDPQDYKWFSKEAIVKLQKAQQEVEWLLGRGYSIGPVTEFVGNSYQFSLRQRNALQRSTTSKQLSEKRKAKEVPLTKAREEIIYIDGFNLIITLEVALSKGILVHGNDGVIRDIAGLRGTYRIIDKTEKALEIIGKTINNLGVPQVKIFLDAPVSNSGRLKSRILSNSEGWNSITEVELVPNPDKILVDLSRVVTSDSIILDYCKSWFNLTGKAIEDYIKEANIIDLSGN